MARWNFHRASARSRLIMRTHIRVWSCEFMFAFDRAKGTLAFLSIEDVSVRSCECMFAIYWANSCSRFFPANHTFTFRRMKAQLRFIERRHISVLSFECTFAFYRANAYLHFFEQMHVRDLSSEFMLVFSREWTFVFNHADASLRLILCHNPLTLCSE